MKGKKRLAKVRHILKENFDFRFEIQPALAKPVDASLHELAKKLFPKVKILKKKG
jgi:hypothetical protein